MVSAWLAAALFASAVVVLVPGPRRRSGRPATDSRSGRVRIVGPWRRRRHRVADTAAVLEVCDLLAAELTVGRPPEAALRAAGRHWPPLGPVVEACHLGADVPAALRSLARERPGAADLRLVAAAWQVAHHSGHGLAAALGRTARGIRARRRTRRLVDSELASARATARLVALLPLAVLLMGSGAGSDPWGFLLTTTIGLACLASGLVLIGLGLWWIERLADAAATP